MTGHSSDPAALHDILWPDAELETVSVDYDGVRLELLESNGRKRTFSCMGYIGYEFVGFWDEVVIETATYRSDDEFLERCLRALHGRLGQAFPDSGSPDRNARSFGVLTLGFADGGALKIAANTFRHRTLEMPPLLHGAPLKRLEHTQH
jgi:hypothetical protein